MHFDAERPSEKRPDEKKAVISWIVKYTTPTEAPRPGLGYAQRRRRPSDVVSEVHHV
jgi:hypothetical protein